MRVTKGQRNCVRGKGSTSVLRRRRGNLASTVGRASVGEVRAGHLKVLGHRGLRVFHCLDQVRRVLFILVRNERHRGTLGTGAPGAAAAVHVLLQVVGRVKVNNERKVADVEAARRDVCRHQHVCLALHTADHLVAVP